MTTPKDFDYQQGARDGGNAAPAVDTHLAGQNSEPQKTIGPTADPAEKKMFVAQAVYESWFLWVP